MNKVVLTSLAMSAVLVLSGCSSSGSHKSAYGGHGGYASYDSCANCGSGSYAVRHGHNGHSVRSGGGSSGPGFAAIAGTLLVGGLLVNALDDDNGNSRGHVK